MLYCKNWILDWRYANALIFPSAHSMYCSKKIPWFVFAECFTRRCSQCLAFVLDNPLSHPVLEKIVVTLKNSLHDKSEMVRAAFLDMLIKMKEVRAAKVGRVHASKCFHGFHNEIFFFVQFNKISTWTPSQEQVLSNCLFFPCQFWDVCTVEHLLARLATDTQCVCKRITNLLLRSFFPVNESEAEWCRRCVTLIQMNPMAARQFYLHVHLHVEPTNVGKRAPNPRWVQAARRDRALKLLLFSLLTSSQVDVGDLQPHQPMR